MVESLRKPSDGEFEGKVVVATGGSRGIGLATLTIFAEAGAHPVSFDITKPDVSGIDFHEVQVTVYGDIEEAAAKVIDDYGQIDVVVNNAAIKVPGRLEDIPLHELKHSADVNTLGPMFVEKAMLRYLRETRGVLINVASGTQSNLPTGRQVYFRTKGGLVAATWTSHNEYKDEGIRVMGIAPGPVDTRLWRSGQTEEEIEAALAGGNGPQVLLPRDVGEMIFKLASTNNAHLAGTIYSY